MIGSAFNSLLLVACLWWNVAFIQCRSTVDVKKHSKLSGQQLARCLRRCALRFQASNVKLSRQQFCYDKCLGKREKLSVTGNNRKHLDDQQKMPSFKKIKRDISNSQQSSTSSWEQGGCSLRYGNGSQPLKADGLRVTFHKLKNTGRYYANVSWKSLHNNSVHGYRVVYVIGDPPYHCKDLKKNETNYIIKNSSYGLRNQSKLFVGVTFLPYKGGKVMVEECTVPMDCTDNTITGGETKSWTTDSPSKNGVTSSATSGRETKSWTTDSSSMDGVTSSATSDIKMNDAVVAAIASGCVIVVLLLSAVVVFLYFRRSHQRPFSRSDLEFEYDAFVIFSSEDSDWVIKTLIPTLEEKHDLKCCVHYRDFTLGVPIRQNMVDSVYKCKKTIAVVSTNFFNSKYCGSELDYALHRLMEKKDDSLVVIKLDNVDRSRLPKELQKRSYIDYPKSTEKETWEKKLIKCIQASSYSTQSNIL